jgi:para-nitrobenzyl esterase
MPAHEPIQDGYVVPAAAWSEAIADGAYTHVPVVLGSTRDEWKDFMPVYGALVKFVSAGKVPTGGQTWLDLFRVIGVGEPLTLTDVLPTPRDLEVYELIASLKSRMLRATGVDALARSLATADPHHHVYTYRFDWSGGDDPALADFKTIFGAAHSMDIPFFQGNSRDFWDISFTAANRDGRVELQGVMMDYLSSFVRTLDPNPERSRLPTWPRWRLADGGPQSITFDADLRHAKLAISTKEETVAGLSEEIEAAMANYPEAAGVFPVFGLVP